MRDAAEAEDVVQEALARAWRARASCRTPDAPTGWCLRITRNEALRHLGRRPAAPAVELDDTRADEHTLDETERALERLTVTNALADLGDGERLLIALRYAHGWSHPEIAAQLRIPEATARVRLHRAQKRLRTLLAEAG